MQKKLRLVCLTIALLTTNTWGEEFTNSIGMKFVLIPAGTFLMGRSESVGSLKETFPEIEMSRFEQVADEEPQHLVTISKDFYIGQYEITVGQFKEFLDKSGYMPESIRDKTGGYGYNKDYDPEKTVKKDAFEGRDLKYSWDSPGFTQGEDHPVTNITWNDVNYLAQWLSNTEGKKYRLPTESEWEYSCLGGKQKRFGSTNNPAELHKFANIFDQETAKYWDRWKNYAQQESDSFAFTAPVGSFEPNDYKLYDMNGNVWEWVSDYYNSYPANPQIDPIGPKDKNLQIRRGGSWHTWAFYSRCQFRNWNTPETRYPLVGGRLVLENE